MLLEELELLDEVEAISVFHPVKEDKVKKLAGGIFLRPQVFNKQTKTKKIVFFDQSLEMRKNLSKVEGIDLVEVFTRKRGAFTSFDVSVEILQSFLQGCEKKLSSIKSKVSSIKKKISKIKFDKVFLFYLGKFSSTKKAPELLIVGDGFVEDLKVITKLKTYSSPLEYVPWSAKIMKKIPKNSIHIAVSDSESLNSFKKVGKNRYNLKFRGALSPGIRQVYLLEFLIGLDL